MSKFDCQDRHFMQRALDLAQLALNNTTPNPRVGCVLVKHNRVIGEGYTQAVGGHHAEMQALINAQQLNENTCDAIAYVSLEPCHHFGHTPPCTKALLEAGIKRVVVATLDPNPIVAGKGIEFLRASGITVEIGLHQEKAIEINAGFFTRMLHQRPWIRLKTASSLDGRTALTNGVSQWITNQAARADGHRWRARACGVMTGIGTILSDDPQLNVRYIGTKRQPLPIILDSRLQIPLTANILKGRPPLIVCASETLLNSIKAKKLYDVGTEIVALPIQDNHPKNESQLISYTQYSSATKKNITEKIDKNLSLSNNTDSHFPLQNQNKNALGIDLNAVALFLAKRQLNEIHVEAGHTLQGAWIKTGLVDELLMYFSPAIIGNSGKGLFLLPEITNLNQMHGFHFKSIELLEDNLRLLLQSKKNLNYLNIGSNNI